MQKRINDMPIAPLSVNSNFVQQNWNISAGEQKAIEKAATKFNEAITALKKYDSYAGPFASEVQKQNFKIMHIDIKKIEIADMKNLEKYLDQVNYSQDYRFTNEFTAHNRLQSSCRYLNKSIEIASKYKDTKDDKNFKNAIDSSINYSKESINYAKQKENYEKMRKYDNGYYW
jgi:hypothetical protein